MCVHRLRCAIRPAEFRLVTLEAYIDKYTSLVPFLADTPTGTPVSDAAPPELTSGALSLQTAVVFDAAPIGKSFGQVLIDVVKTTAYKVGDTVVAQFVGANPRVRPRALRYSASR
jgi:neutral ceramidase